MSELINTLYPVDILINYHHSSLFIVIARCLSLLIVEPLLMYDFNCGSFQGSYPDPKNEYIYNIINSVIIFYPPL